MIHVVQGDLLNVRDGCIVHQTNCRGVIGSGIAKQIRDRWPQVYHAYKEMCDTTNPYDLFGDCQFVFVDNLCIVNLFGQLNYSMEKMIYTNYEAFRSCCKIMEHHIPYTDRISIPYGIGCGLGGGDWDIILSIITEELKTMRFICTVNKRHAAVMELADIRDLKS